MPNVLVLPGSGQKAVKEMFQFEGWTIITDLDDADLVQFVGGEDVSPELYGQRLHKTTRSNPERDASEREIFLQAVDQGIPVSGICRGGQFLNVMNGGRMFQDVDGHGGVLTHDAYLPGAVLPVKVTSTHHQMMEPNWSTDVKLLLTAACSTRKYHMSDTNSNLAYEVVTYPDTKGNKHSDIECVYYPGTRSLCFQPHPEFTTAYAKETREVYFMLMENYLFGGLSEELLRDEA